MANDTKSKTVKIRLKHGRMMIARGAEGAPDKFAEAGDIFDVPRDWAEKLLKRSFDGYPGGALPGTVHDCPIELVA